MGQPITYGAALIALLFALGGIAGAFVVVRVLSGYVKGMPR
jgi:hypothetical protein